MRFSAFQPNSKADPTLGAASSEAMAAAGSHSLRIFGVDPGLQRTGYAIVEVASTPHGPPNLREAGVIRLPSKLAIEKRLLELHDGLEQLLQAYRPNLLVCEQLYAHYRHPRTAILMGHARGVILALAARRGIAVASVASTHVKRMLTGNGHAGKGQMQRAVAASLRLHRLPEPHDVADAIAIALSGLRLTFAARSQP